MQQQAYALYNLYRNLFTKKDDWFSWVELEQVIANYQRDAQKWGWPQELPQ